MASMTDTAPVNDDMPLISSDSECDSDHYLEDIKTQKRKKAESKYNSVQYEIKSINRLKGSDSKELLMSKQFTMANQKIIASRIKKTILTGVHIDRLEAKEFDILAKHKDALTDLCGNLRFHNITKTGLADFLSTIRYDYKYIYTFMIYVILVH